MVLVTRLSVEQFSRATSEGNSTDSDWIVAAGIGNSQLETGVVDEEED